MHTEPFNATGHGLTLVSHALCPYVQRAQISLTEKGVPHRRLDVDLSAKPDWFTAISPLGKVPLLAVARTESVIFESAAILEYLEDTQPPALHPADPLIRARHRGWIEFGSGILNLIAAFYNAPDKDALSLTAAQLATRFRQVEHALGPGPYFAGPAFSLVDAAFGPVFRYFDVFDHLDTPKVLDGLPKIALWRAALAARRSVQDAVAPDYNARLTDFIIRRRGALGRMAA